MCLHLLHWKCLFDNITNIMAYAARTLSSSLFITARGISLKNAKKIGGTPLTQQLQRYSSSILRVNVWKCTNYKRTLIADPLGFSCAKTGFGSTAIIRHNSSTPVPDAVTSISQSLPPGYIPPPPSIPEVGTVLPEAKQIILNALGEQTLASLDLAHSTPAGLVQMALETMHVAADLPWWGAIVIGTIIVRLCLFPLVVMAQRNAAHMANHMPTVQKLQQRFSQARMSGNSLHAARAGQELMEYMKINKVKPFKSLLVPFAQVPIFLSVFVGLRQMSNLPVESMMTGGILWFTDLTLADPYYLLPLMTMTTFYITVEFGVDGMKATQMTHTMKWAMRAMPFIVFPFILHFPTAMLCYWFTSNAFSLTQVMFLRIPGVREFFKIPKIIDHKNAATQTQKGFVEGFKDTWSNSKLMAEVEDRQRVDYVKFKDAGTDPIKKTYTNDPTKTKAKAKQQV